MKLSTGALLVVALGWVNPARSVAQRVCDPWGTCYTIPPRTAPERRPSDSRSGNASASSAANDAARYDKVVADAAAVWKLASSYTSDAAKVDAYTHLLDLLHQQQALRDGPNVQRDISTIEALRLWSVGVISDRNHNYLKARDQLMEAQRRRPDLFNEDQGRFIAAVNWRLLAETPQEVVHIVDMDSVRMTDVGPGPVNPETWRQFQLAMIAEKRNSDRLLREIGAGIDRIKVPSPYAPTREIKEGIFQGLTQSQRDADEMMLREMSPWEKRSYAELHRTGAALALAFGTNDEASEYRRGAMDHLSLGSYTMNLEYVRTLMPALQGTHFGRLIAHSNGATVAEALLHADVIRVDELVIMGGDRALVNRRSLQELLNSGKVKRVRIFLNPGDPVPIFTSGPLSAGLEFARAEAYYIRKVLTGEAPKSDGLWGKPDDRIQVYYLDEKGGHKEWSWRAHDFSAYMANVRVWLGG